MPFADIEVRKAYNKQYAKDHPEKFAASKVKWRRSRSALIQQAKNKPCKDCGIVLPSEIMELDHISGEKTISFGYNGYDASIDRLEISRCEVRCPNCHRLRHYNLRRVKDHGR
jgi:hypothetical protein